MVKHIVTFKLTGTAEERREVAERFKAALLALPQTIDVLQSIEVGINENPAESWDVVLTAIVPTMADVSTYACHPDHVAAAGLLAGYKAGRACVDYEVAD
ncbi:MAG: Dabb family protein [Muribaculaceae bacterium]